MKTYCRVRHGRKNMRFDPLAVEPHVLRVAAEAEIARLAAEGEQDIVPTGIAVDAREAVVRIAAFEKEDLMEGSKSQPTDTP